MRKIFPVKIVYSFLLSKLRPDIVEVQEHKMFLDSKDSLGLSLHEVYEKLKTIFSKKKSKKK
ncbi:MAG: hypothetical protein J7K26_00825 [Candidatus Aenigmarchaeota archaeon]|nr:hypothetical protein [Candidatus Aenigmarchaeota archaeon]